MRNTRTNPTASIGSLLHKSANYFTITKCHGIYTRHEWRWKNEPQTQREKRARQLGQVFIKKIAQVLSVNSLFPIG